MKIPRSIEKLKIDELDEHDRFIYQFGLAISAWQFVESALGHLFVEIVSGKNNQSTAYAIYNAVVSFEVRIAMINAAFTSNKSNEKHLKAWEFVQKRILNKAKLRNRLAHLMIVNDVDAKANKVSLVPNIIKKEAFEKAMKGNGIRYNVKQVEEMRDSFLSLTTELFLLMRTIEHSRLRKKPRK
jgi:hypothetical protein